MSVPSHISSPAAARSRRRARRAVLLKTLAGAALALLLATLTCVLAHRFNVLVYLPLDPDNRLSPRLLQSLENLPAPVRVTLLMRPTHRAFDPAARLLRAMQAASEPCRHDLTFRIVDPVRDLAPASDLFRAGAPENSLILETPSAREVVLADDLFTTPDSGAAPSLATIETFAGDRVLADALRRFNGGLERPLYWLTGHGEGAVDDYSPAGFSDTARELRRRGYPSRPLHLLETAAIPSDAAALVIAAPRRGLAPEELAILSDYLAHGGRLLYMADMTPSAQNEHFLTQWGLALTAFHAVGSRTLTGEELLALNYPDHPAAAPLTGTATLFASPRVIQPADAAAHITVQPVVMTAASGWGTATPNAPRQYHPQTDLPGPVAFIMTAELGEQARTDIGLTRTRIALTGESVFASNLFVRRGASANVDLVASLIDWLTGGETASSDAPGASPLTLHLSRDGWLFLALLTAALLPGIPFTLLLVRLFRRRR